MPQGTHVRRATAHDLGLLGEHRRRMWQDLGDFAPRELAASHRTYSRWLARRWTEGRIVGFVAVDRRGRPTGSLTVWLHDVEPSPNTPSGVTPVLSTLYVHPEHRSKRIGSSLVAAATAWCRVKGHPYVTAVAASTSRRLLRRAGYVRLWEMGVAFEPQV